MRTNSLKKVLPIVFLLTFGLLSSALAQNAYRWEVNLNSLVLFKSTPDRSLWLKHYTKSGTIAYRLRGWFYRFKGGSEDRGRFFPNSKPTVSLYISPGVEFHHGDGKFSWYYGFELPYDYQYSDIGVVIGVGGGGSTGGVSLNRDQKKYQSIGLSGLLGCKYFFLPKLSISAESQLMYYYDVANNRATVNAVVRQERLSGNTISTIPIYALNLGYRF